MPYRVTESTLNASTLDILNVIRANASYEYQSLVPVVETTNDIPKVGEVLYGHPGLANQFLNALMNRIALVRARGATFNNPYSSLKKGYLRFGETVEEVFVELAKAVEFSADKGASRELKRTLPKVRAAFHTINWRVMYPITIQNEDLRMAFESAEGVQDMIAKIVDSIYTAAEYDEFLLFKYLIIKGVNSNAIKPILIPAGDDESPADTDKRMAIAFRGTSNALEFVSNKYNASSVHTNTKKPDQYIFMDAQFNAQFDVNVLASAFNMDKADFMGHLKLIDDWTSFDNERFDVIRANSDGLAEITAEELAKMSEVKAVLVDSEWFQIYDNNNQFTETYVASGLYWNYFYHVWKTVSWSPFSNAVCFFERNDDTPLTITVGSVDKANGATVVTLKCNRDDVIFKQTGDLTENGIAVTPSGIFIIPNENSPIPITFAINGEEETVDKTYAALTTVGAEVYREQ